MVQFEEQHRVIVAPSINVAFFDLVLRRNREERKIFGILAGTRSDFGGSIAIRSCYPLPAKSTANAEGIKSIMELHKCVYPKDFLLGYFCISTGGTDLNDEEVETFRNFYLREVASSAIQMVVQISLDKPVFVETKHVSLQTQPESGKRELQMVDLEPAIECSLPEYNLCKLMNEGLTEESSFVEGDASIVLDDYRVNLDQKAEGALNSLVQLAYGVLGEEQQ